MMYPTNFHCEGQPEITGIFNKQIFIHEIENLSINHFSAKPIFGRKKKKSFRKFYSYFSFYAREKNFQ